MPAQNPRAPPSTVRVLATAGKTPSEEGASNPRLDRHGLHVTAGRGRRPGSPAFPVGVHFPGSGVLAAPHVVQGQRLRHLATGFALEQ